jgi:hypothetical protein
MPPANGTWRVLDDPTVKCADDPLPASGEPCKSAFAVSFALINEVNGLYSFNKTQRAYVKDKTHQIYRSGTTWHLGHRVVGPVYYASRTPDAAMPLAHDWGCVICTASFAAAPAPGLVRCMD